MSTTTLDISVADTQLVACPQCRTPFFFRRSPAPQIDACGFECYHFDCETCGVPLAGLIDPTDDALLLSATPA